MNVIVCLSFVLISFANFSGKGSAFGKAQLSRVGGSESGGYRPNSGGNM